MEVFEAFDVIRDTIDGLRKVVDKAQHEVGKSGPPIGSPPDKPLGVGDWVLGTYLDGQQESTPLKVTGINQRDVFTGGFRAAWPLNTIRIVRRSDAPLQKGDRGLLDGKIEVWIADPAVVDGLIDFVFAKENIESFYKEDFGEGGFIRPDRFTLVEPVYPDGEKLSGKEKED